MHVVAFWRQTKQINYRKVNKRKSRKRGYVNANSASSQQTKNQHPAKKKKKKQKQELKKRPKFSCDFLFSSDKRRRSESASIVLSPVPLCDQSDFILPNTSVPPFTTAPPKRCNLFSLFELLFTLTIDCDGDTLGRRPDSEFVDEFIDDVKPAKFL